MKKNHLTKPIAYILSDSCYSTLHYADGTKNMICTTLKKLEGLGIRIHKQVIINPDYIRQILGSGTLRVQMNDLSVHPVARRRVIEFNDKVKRTLPIT